MQRDNWQPKVTYLLTYLLAQYLYLLSGTVWLNCMTPLFLSV